MSGDGTDQRAESNESDERDRFETCRAAAQAGARQAHERFRSELFVETKDGGIDAVTEADRSAQRTVTDVIREQFPGEPVVGEEEDAPKSVPAAGPAWVVDPIDGTNNYVAGNRTWVTAVACVRDAEPVAAAVVGPATGDTYLAGDGPTRRNGEPVSVRAESDPESFLVNPLYGLAPTHQRELADSVATIVDRFGDVRRFGCAQAVLAGVAAGELHAAVSTVPLNDWDTIAGVHLIRRAGGTVTDAAGDRWTPGATGLLASNGEAHDTLVDAFDPVDG